MARCEHNEYHGIFLCFESDAFDNEETLSSVNIML